MLIHTSTFCRRPGQPPIIVLAYHLLQAHPLSTISPTSPSAGAPPFELCYITTYPPIAGAPPLSFHICHHRLQAQPPSTTIPHIYIYIYTHNYITLRRRNPLLTMSQSPFAGAPPTSNPLHVDQILLKEVVPL